MFIQLIIDEMIRAYLLLWVDHSKAFLKKAAKPVAKKSPFTKTVGLRMKSLPYVNITITLSIPASSKNWVKSDRGIFDFYPVFIF